LYERVEAILTYEREKYKGELIIVKYCFWNKAKELIKIAKLVKSVN